MPLTSARRSVRSVALATALAGCAAPARTPSESPSTEPPAALAPAPASSLRRTVDALRRVRVEEGDTKVPPAARPLLVELKGELEKLVGAALAEPKTIDASADAIANRINEKLEAEGVLTAPVEDEVYDPNADNSYLYGDVYEVAVSRPDGHPDLLAVTTTIGVCCGSDTSLYLYEKRAAVWSLLLAHAAKEYDEVSGARGRFQFVVSPADARGEFFCVAANVNPWCTSNWQSLRFAVLRPSADPHAPRVVLDDKRTIFLDDDPAYSLSTTRDTFALTFKGDKAADMIVNGGDFDDEAKSTTLLRYQVSGRSVKKLVER